MNREIKFRVFSIAENKFLWYFPNDIINLIWSQSHNDKPLDYRTGRLFYSKDVNYILQQYTGLKDKNGKEIYEGDICRWPSGHLSKIEWNNNRACFNAVGITQSKGVSRGGIVPTHIEVIGNIYENENLISK